MSKVNPTWKKTIAILTATVLLLVSLLSFFPAAASEVADEPTSLVESKVYCSATIDDDFTDDCILVTLSHAVSFEDYSTFTAEYLGLTNVKAVTSLFEGTKNGILDGEEHLQPLEDEFNQILRITLAEKGKENVLAMVKLAEQNPNIIAAEPNYILTDEIGDAAYPLNDSYIGSGATYAPYDQINLYGAWNISTGSSDVKVGVMDSGVMNSVDDSITVTNSDETTTTYSNLLSTYTLDETELQASVVTGYDFYNKNSVTNDDVTGHGTRVASVLGAIGNNGKGISGVNQTVSIVPLQVSYNTPGVTNFDINAQIAAYNWCNTNNIPIINYSGSGTTISTARTTAMNNYYGLIVVTSGNDRYSLDENPKYPAVQALDNKICVGGTNTSTGANEYNWSSTYVDIMAPATSLKTIHPYLTSSSRTTKGEYMTQGTSFAAPMVAGTAALLLSINPDLTTAQLKDIILSSAQKKSTLTDYCVEGRFLDVTAAAQKAQATLVSGVSLKSTTTLTVGGAETLTPTITPSTAINQNVTWTSSNTSVATVNTSGKVTAISAGTANITVTTEDGNYTATCVVTVKSASTTGFNRGVGPVYLKYSVQESDLASYAFKISDFWKDGDPNATGTFSGNIAATPDADNLVAELPAITEPGTYVLAGVNVRNASTTMPTGDNAMGSSNRIIFIIEVYADGSVTVDNGAINIASATGARTIITTGINKRGYAYVNEDDPAYTYTLAYSSANQNCPVELANAPIGIAVNLKYVTPDDTSYTFKVSDFWKDGDEVSGAITGTIANTTTAGEVVELPVITEPGTYVLAGSRGTTGMGIGDHYMGGTSKIIFIIKVDEYGGVIVEDGAVTITATGREIIEFKTGSGFGNKRGVAYIDATDSSYTYRLTYGSSSNNNCPITLSN